MTNLIAKNEVAKLSIPFMGYGTYKTKDAGIDVYPTAIEQGYSFFDTASIYETEHLLGEGIKSSGVSREKLFIQSKLWWDERGYEQAKEALKRALKRLETDYIDLYLIHWPKGSPDETGWEEKNLETWRALEDCRKEGLIRGAGVSNFLPHHLDSLIRESKITPLVNQLEIHIGYTQSYAVNYCNEKGICVQAWSPLGRGDLLSDDFILSLAQKYDKTPSQIALKFLTQKGIIPIVKASSAKHMRENIDVLDFELSFSDMSRLECYPKSTWRGEHPDVAPPSLVSSSFLC